MVGIVAVLLLGGLGGRDVWLPWAISWAIPDHMQMDMHRMETSLFPPALRVIGLHLADTAAGWEVEAGALEASGIAWKAGKLHAHRFFLDSATCLVDVPSGKRQTANTSFNLSVSVDELGWNHLHVSTPSEAILWDHGIAKGLKLQPHGRHVDQLSWDTCRWRSARLPETLVLGPSALSVEEHAEGWSVESDGMQLPGVQFNGTFGWPLRETHGKANVDWRKVPTWMLKAVGLHKLEPCWNESEFKPSTLIWAATSESWQLVGQGPCGLTLEAQGTSTTWSAQAQMNQLPPPWREATGTDKWNVTAEGRDSTFLWSAEALPALSAQGEGHLNLRSRHAQLQGSISTLGRFVQGPNETLTASISLKNVLNWELGQPEALHPWQLSGSANTEGTTFRLNRTWPLEDPVQGTVTWGHTGMTAYQMEAQLGEGQRSLTAKAGYSPDQNELTLEVAAAHTRAQLTADANSVDWLSWWQSVRSREQTTWPSMRGSGMLTPASPCWTWIGEQAADAHVTWNLESTPQHMHATVQGDSVRWNGSPQGSWSLAANGSPQDWLVQMEGNSPQMSLQVALKAGSNWTLEVDGVHPQAGNWNTSLNASLGANGWDMQLNEGTWEWPDLDPTCPTLVLDTPLTWKASAQHMWPSHVNLEGALGHVTIAPKADGFAVQGTAGASALHLLQESLDLNTKALACEGRWSEGTLALDLSLNKARWNTIDLTKAEVAATFADETLSWSLRGLDSLNVPLLDARGRTSLHEPERLQVRMVLIHAPATWGQAWVPEGWLSFGGHVSGSVDVMGSASSPSLQGTLALDSVRLTVPNMGTWFEIDGPVRILPDAWLVDRAQVRDAMGQEAAWNAALYHDKFRDINVDVHAFDMSGPMRVLDLPKDVDLPLSGVLDAEGEASMFFWNNQFTVSGDAQVLGASDCQISLVSEDAARWEDLVTFVDPATADPIQAVELQRAAQRVILSLDLDIDRSAQATLVTDRDNSVKMGGRTQGALSLVLEDWERLTLAGGLEIVEGECEFVLGPFLSKDFILQSGGMLTWDGDPYAGQIDVTALHTLRANVTPLVGEVNGQGRRMEDVHVSLLLDGDMLQPEIDFMLGAPDAENVVQSAMASVLVDDAERTAQAIALLSLQEFLPNQFNTLSLGTEGLQSNSVDMLTSQVSRWLSNLNDDVEIGLSYDAAGALLTEEESQQDALQLAMKAAFLDNRLHVEGEMGSNPTLESLGGANLQEVRVSYELDPEKGLQLVGFSENSPTQGQIGSQSTQGVGIRWHRSFNWIWPWQRPNMSNDQPKEDGSKSS